MKKYLFSLLGFFLFSPLLNAQTLDSLQVYLISKDSVTTDMYVDFSIPDGKDISFIEISVIEKENKKVYWKANYDVITENDQLNVMVDHEKIPENNDHLSFKVGLDNTLIKLIDGVVVTLYDPKGNIIKNMTKYF